MPELTEKSKELFKFLQNAYINDGYMYSGSWPYNSLYERGFRMEDIGPLEKAKLIQRRDCDAVAYELTVDERAKLLDEHHLGTSWVKHGTGIYDSINVELRFVTEHRTIPKPNITVKTLHHKDDIDAPKEVDVYSPFYIGQMLNIEYDIHRRVSAGYAGHSHLGSKAMGLFMVTDIIRNLLVFPRENMIELQALDADFIKLYPNERSNLYFESLVMKRVREPAKTLDAKIQQAQMKSDANNKASMDQNTKSFPER